MDPGEAGTLLRTVTASLYIAYTPRWQMLGILATWPCTCLILIRLYATGANQARRPAC